MKITVTYEENEMREMASSMISAGANFEEVSKILNENIKISGTHFNATSIKNENDQRITSMEISSKVIIEVFRFIKPIANMINAMIDLFKSFNSRLLEYFDDIRVSKADPWFDSAESSDSSKTASSESKDPLHGWDTVSGGSSHDDKFDNRE